MKEVTTEQYKKRTKKPQLVRKPKLMKRQPIWKQSLVEWKNGKLGGEHLIPRLVPNPD